MGATCVTEMRAAELFYCYSGGIKERRYDEIIAGARYRTYVRTMSDGKTVCYIQSVRQDSTGYMILRDAEGKAVATVEQLGAGREVDTCFAEGRTYEIDRNIPNPRCPPAQPVSCQSGQCSWP